MSEVLAKVDDGSPGGRPGHPLFWIPEEVHL
jgi:hypothetical protein